jgi:hypothetical protein
MSLGSNSFPTRHGSCQEGGGVIGRGGEPRFETVVSYARQLSFGFLTEVQARFLTIVGDDLPGGQVWPWWRPSGASHVRAWSGAMDLEQMQIPRSGGAQLNGSNVGGGWPGSNVLGSSMAVCQPWLSGGGESLAQRRWGELSSTAVAG